MVWRTALMVHRDNHVNYLTVMVEKYVLSIHLLVILTTVLRISLGSSIKMICHDNMSWWHIVSWCLTCWYPWALNLPWKINKITLTMVIMEVTGHRRRGQFVWGIHISEDINNLPRDHPQDKKVINRYKIIQPLYTWVLYQHSTMLTFICSLKSNNFSYI